MKTSKNRTLFSLGILLVALLSISSDSANWLRGTTVSSFGPFFNRMADFKLLMQSPFDRFSGGEVSDAVKTKDQEIKRLLLENQLLGNEVSRLKELVEEEYALVHQMLEDPVAKGISVEALNRHQEQVLALFNLELQNVPARVIFRPLNAWNSSLWVDKGAADNVALGKEVVAKNSPVVLGTSVVGVVDYVGEKQSRVRLITDSGLNPSVRVKRGGWLLAKGELRGQSAAVGRSHAARLLGIGFNYDFADKEGPARDLRSGEPLEKRSKVPAMPIVQLNDLLITTGMDGVFPPGLLVGTVKKIDPLKEGDFAYDLEAESAAGDLNSLSLVFILPPQSNDLN